VDTGQAPSWYICDDATVTKVDDIEKLLEKEASNVYVAAYTKVGTTTTHLERLRGGGLSHTPDPFSVHFSDVAHPNVAPGQKGKFAGDAPTAIVAPSPSVPAADPPDRDEILHPPPSYDVRPEKAKNLKRCQKRTLNHYNTHQNDRGFNLHSGNGNTMNTGGWDEQHHPPSGICAGQIYTNEAQYLKAREFGAGAGLVLPEILSALLDGGMRSPEDDIFMLKELHKALVKMSKAGRGQDELLEHVVIGVRVEYFCCWNGGRPAPKKFIPFLASKVAVPIQNHTKWLKSRLKMLRLPFDLLLDRVSPFFTEEEEEKATHTADLLQVVKELRDTPMDSRATWVVFAEFLRAYSAHRFFSPKFLNHLMSERSYDWWVDQNHQVRPDANQVSLGLPFSVPYDVVFPEEASSNPDNNLKRELQQRFISGRGKQLKVGAGVTSSLPGLADAEEYVLTSSSMERILLMFLSQEESALQLGASPKSIEIRLARIIETASASSDKTLPFVKRFGKMVSSMFELAIACHYRELWSHWTKDSTAHPNYVLPTAKELDFPSVTAMITAANADHERETGAPPVQVIIPSEGNTNAKAEVCDTHCISNTRGSYFLHEHKKLSGKFEVPSLLFFLLVVIFGPLYLTPPPPICPEKLTIVFPR
jgi:hypothetical protein